MGVTKSGRFAALTNVRDPRSFQASRKSRGLIISTFLESTVAPQDYLRRLTEDADDYNGFNIILGTIDRLIYFNSATKQSKELTPGVHGLSNDQLNTPWPKVVRAKSRLEEIISQSPSTPESLLLAMLHDDSKAADHELPDTGVGIEKERWLSPIFIRTKEYGTRCSTLLLSRRDGDIQYIERTFDTETEAVSLRHHRFAIDRNTINQI